MGLAVTCSQDGYTFVIFFGYATRNPKHPYQHRSLYLGLLGKCCSTYAPKFAVKAIAYYPTITPIISATQIQALFHGLQLAPDDPLLVHYADILPLSSKIRDETYIQDHRRTSATERSRISKKKYSV